MKTASIALIVAGAFLFLATLYFFGIVALLHEQAPLEANATVDPGGFLIVVYRQLNSVPGASVNVAGQGFAVVPAYTSPRTVLLSGYGAYEVISGMDATAMLSSLVVSISLIVAGIAEMFAKEKKKEETIYRYMKEVR